jgi:general secretion pathway protein C
LRKTIWLTNILIIGLILWQAGELVLSWTTRKATPQEVRIPPSTLPNHDRISQAVSSFSDFGPLIGQNIFKSHGAGSEPPRVPEPAKEIEVTKLDLKLKGTVIGENQLSYAVIQQGKGGREGLFYLRDRLEGAQILQILSDRIILGIHGKEEALIMTAESEPGVQRQFPPGRSLFVPPPHEEEPTPTISMPRPQPQRRMVPRGRPPEGTRPHEGMHPPEGTHPPGDSPGIPTPEITEEEEPPEEGSDEDGG